jgi:nicotinamide mononucleotide transporter
MDWLFTAELHIGDQAILWREIVGNGFGLASALGGMRRRVWAWPVGIIGNVLLFTVFMGAVFDTPQDKTLWGQAGRQIFFVAVSLWGWYRWRQSERSGEVADGRAIRPRCSGGCSASSGPTGGSPRPGSSLAAFSRRTAWPAAGSSSG